MTLLSDCSPSRSSYIAGCRCPGCRQANREYIQAYRRRTAPRPITPTSAVPAEEWREAAACRGMGPTLFFSDDPADLSRARALCAGCPVREECRQAAVRHPDTVGVWAGIRLRRPRSRR